MSEKDFKIKLVRAREILDSRGNPTVEAEIFTYGGFFGRAAVPSGASTGEFEALELRDNDKKRFHGKGVLKAVKNVNEVLSKIAIGMDVREQESIDKAMIEADGTKGKTKFGANAILSVSLASSRAAADGLKIPLYRYIAEYVFKKEFDRFVLPIPFMNILNGGKHAGSELAIQEFMIVPIMKKNFKENLRAGSEIYHTLRGYLLKKYGKSAINVGDEGGFAPPMKLTSEPLTAIVDSIEETGYVPGKDVVLALDSAASVFFRDGKYHIDGKEMAPGELVDYYVDLTKTFPIKSLEDPFDENDFETFAELTKKVGDKIQVVGDDLYVTNVERIKKGLELGSTNSLLLKVNQIGTLTEAVKAATLMLENGFSVVVSHRSGETEDPFIADLTVGLGVGQIKTGAPARAERTCKYNQLLRIEEELGGDGVYASVVKRENLIYI
ncbi:MAG: phosphopyruvate hydratase [Candidatus Asgardarchaeia archaeon]